MSTTSRSAEVPAFTPSDPEAERRILGILIRHPDHVDTAVEKLKPDHFVEPVHRRIYEAVLDIYSQGGRVSYTQVYNRLRKEGNIPGLDEVLIRITESFISPAELEPSIEILVDKQAKRALLKAAEEIQRMVLLETEESLSALQARAQELVFQATTHSDEEDVKDLIEVLNKCYMNLVDRREGKRPSGLPVRFAAIDAMTTGFKNKDLIILAARPSMGKTSLALNFAVNVAKPPRRIPVLIFSLEMDDEQIGDRLVISELFRFRKPDGTPEITSMQYNTRLDDEQFAKVQAVFSELYKLPIFICDRRGMTVNEIRAKARKVKAENPRLGLIIIDYLQLIKPSPASSKHSYTLQVGEIVRELRDLAGELDLPIILLSQLNRSVEQRENKRPVMSDLRDSGNIEEFADVVMFLYREDYYFPDKAKENGTEGYTEVIFAKQRKGPTGSCHIRFEKEFTKFIEEYHHDR